MFETPDGPTAVETGATIFALGGASWPRLGSDGHWTTIFAEAGIAVSPLKPSNCGFAADFSDLFRERFEGQPLKGAEFSFGGERVRGEAVVTRIGLEGGAVYALSPQSARRHRTGRQRDPHDRSAARHRCAGTLKPRFRGRVKSSRFQTSCERPPNWRLSPSAFCMKRHGWKESLSPRQRQRNSPPG